MRFVARQPREGINVSETHPLAEAGVLIVGLTAIFVGIALVLIFLVEVSLYFVSAEKEAAIFASWMPEDLITVSTEDERLEATQALVNRLVVHWLDTPYNFRVVIEDSELANAMALPGGLIVVTQGLLDQVESENELAFVLGHELGHFRNRDQLRALGRVVALSLFFTAVMGSDVAGIGIKAADLTLRGFSRKQESKADAFGLAIVNAEYGHVSEAWRLFERWGIRDDSMSGFIAYFSTHPDTGDRIWKLQVLAETNAWRLDGVSTPLRW
ncbi:MAG: M48 family metallopeptidase [Proteobacteria bacterium]|nr:M48 family metallopeptidase [Pseudomonadota bacterium]